jgi:uracil phosphoribosyltransferase
MRDSLYEKVPFKLSELVHHYGKNVHLVGNPFLMSQLATLCAKGVIQPQINRLVALLYTDLIKMVLNAEFPRKAAAIPTRMIDVTPQGIYQGEIIDPEVRAVTVNIARAGTLPSQVAFDLLNTIVQPALVRQDHIIMSRMLDDAEKVVGSNIGGAKIGGDIDDAFVLFPDPMGATGGSLSTAIKMYKEKVPGTPKRIICVNLRVLAADDRRSPGRRDLRDPVGPRDVSQGGFRHRARKALGEGAGAGREAVHRPRRRWDGRADEQRVRVIRIHGLLRERRRCVD